MSTVNPLLSEAMKLLNEDLLIHLDQAASLATQADDWSEQDADAARGVIGDLVLMIRGLLMEHGRQPTNECRTCAYDWPAPWPSPFTDSSRTRSASSSRSPVGSGMLDDLTQVSDRKGSTGSQLGPVG